jgi:deoxyribodipyrimidine photo-lyase
MKISVFWFRRDLRLEDNTALNHALDSGFPVLPLFIFDQNIIRDLPVDDPRITFIHKLLRFINHKLNEHGSSIKILKGQPGKVWKNLISDHEVENVYVNKDYEPYALERDNKIRALLNQHGIRLYEFKDQVIFEGNEVVKDNGEPYTVYTPYKNRWLQRFYTDKIGAVQQPDLKHLLPSNHSFPSLAEIGFRESNIKVRKYDLSQLDDYATMRDLPAADSTSYLGPHLRFGTISIRHVIQQLKPADTVFLSELIWREFFMQILFHFPRVVHRNFKSRYDGIAWKNDEHDFEQWCQGNTGYPMVDAGMRQLNTTGYMHNRVRMVVASFLCKHLLIDWIWGESYFAEKLLDYELSSNNGNWQWAAGTGCDAAPYFRVFNPAEQIKKYDRELNYVKKWVPEFGTSDYVQPIVEHTSARRRALETYKKAIES